MLRLPALASSLRQRSSGVLLLASIAIIAAALMAPVSWVGALAPRSVAYINGVPTQVTFSDGDTFNQKEGPLQGNSRLAGFNTLESFGPVHQWGTWHPYELWVNAKQATLHARRGIWHCTGKPGERDTYDRNLMDCPDLAVAQIRKGFAHAMEIDDSPSRRKAYLRAQAAAMRENRGMWAHGKPTFIVTSLHSASEGGRDIYSNRLVSTRDGHSERWEHNDTYETCSWQCSTLTVADAAQVNAQAFALRSSPLAKDLAQFDNGSLTEIVDRFARLQSLPAWVPAEGDNSLAAQLKVWLGERAANGAFSGTHSERGACGIYVPFEIRYGRNRSECLKRYGNWETEKPLERLGPVPSAATTVKTDGTLRHDVDHDTSAKDER